MAFYAEVQHEYKESNQKHLYGHRGEHPLRGPLFRYRNRVSALLPGDRTLWLVLLAAILALFNLRTRPSVRDLLRRFKGVYSFLEERTLLRGPLSRYRTAFFSRLAPGYNLRAVLRAAVLALPGAASLHRFYVRLRYESRPAPISRDMPGLFRIDVDSDPSDATTLAELTAPGFRRAAFEVYRNALYAGMVNAMEQVVETAASGLGRDIREMPVGRLLRQFAGPQSSGNEYERLLRLASDLDPWMAEPHYMLGRLLLAAGKEDEAIHQFRLAATGDVTVKLAFEDLPVQARAYFEIGGHHLRKGRSQQAVPFLKRAIELCPGQSFPPANLALGQALLETGRYAEGAEYCLAALAYVSFKPTLPPFAERLAP